MTKQEFLAMSLPHKLKVYVKYNHKPDNSELETMIGKTVKYRDKIYQVNQWIHYRLEWFEVELKDNSGYHKFWLKESDVVIL